MKTIKQLAVNASVFFPKLILIRVPTPSPAAKQKHKINHIISKKKFFLVLFNKVTRRTAQTQWNSNPKPLCTVSKWAWVGQAGSCVPVNWVLSPDLFSNHLTSGNSRSWAPPES